MYLISDSVVVLTFKGKRYNELRFQCGLPQGGPLSALLFVLCAEPLLCAFEAVEGVKIALGFIDDWLAGVHNLQFISRLQRICEIFMAASGLVINQGKCVILISRLATPDEVVLLRSQWPNCKIVVRHKIVGIWYGIDVELEEQ